VIAALATLIAALMTADLPALMPFARPIEMLYPDEYAELA
jgi:hypothetical protein